MRHFQTLDRAAIDENAGILLITASEASYLSVEIALRLEGDYLLLSASYGAFELALRLRRREFTRALTHIQPIDGLHTTRQVGTGNAFLGVGLHSNRSLVLRPTIVGDATGYTCLNLRLTPDARQTLYDWIGIGAVSTSEDAS